MMILSFCIMSWLMADSPDGFWPNWRGPDANGIAHEAKLPTTWNETTNVRWKVAIPGLGLATPAIWGDRLFVLTAVRTERAAEQVAEPDKRRSWMKPVMPDRVHQFVVMALDRHTGKTLWRQVALEKVPHETTHGDASWASLSPVTDGRYLIASFGSAGVFCYDLNGKQKWSVDLGDMRTRNGFGEGSSPIIHGDSVIVNWDHEDQSFIVALDLGTGTERWRIARDEPTSWSTPAIAESGGKTHVVVSATNKIRGYDLATGAVIWECAAGMTLNTIPTPIVDGSRIYAASGFRGNAVIALDIKGAKGDITGTDHVLWRNDRDAPYVPSMLLYEDNLYYLKRNDGILTRVDAKTGKTQYGPLRLEEIKGVYASPIGASGHVYIVGRSGTTMVLENGPEYKVVAVNKLDDRFDASPAVAGNALYLRGRDHLYCIGEP